MDLSIIIPVFNGEKTLTELKGRIKNELEHGYTYEILYVYDCGKDNSWRIIQDLISKDPVHIKGFHLKRNYGQHNAILFGMTRASGDLVVTLDEDLQHDPRFIKDLLITQEKGDFDVVYGIFEKLQHPGFRIRTSEMLRKLLKLFVKQIYPDYSSYRLMKNKIAMEISAMKNSYNFIDGYIGLTTTNITGIPVKHYKRADGKSSYSYYKLVKHAGLIIIAFSKIKIWFLLTSLAFNLMAIVTYSLDHIIKKQYCDILTIVFFIIGITLLALGLIAEMIHYGNLKYNTKPVEIR